MKDHCRNNVGTWPTREVAAPRGAKGFDYYSLKDRAMAETAEYGLMLWDGKSKGTVNNVVNRSRDHKPVVGYVAPTKQFGRSAPLTISGIFAGDSHSVERIVNELHLEIQRIVRLGDARARGVENVETMRRGFYAEVHRPPSGRATRADTSFIRLILTTAPPRQ